MLILPCRPLSERIVIILPDGREIKIHGDRNFTMKVSAPIDIKITRTDLHGKEIPKKIRKPDDNYVNPFSKNYNK